MKKLLAAVLSMAMLGTMLVTAVSAEETKYIINESIIHPYLTFTDGQVPEENVSYDAEKGGHFFNGNGASSYTKIGTNWVEYNFPYDGLRLEFSNITMNGASADLKSRIAVELSPNKDGATGLGSAYNGLIFYPGAGFFGNTDLLLSIGGGVQNLPEEWIVGGNNLIEAFYVKPGTQPFAHLFEDDASYSIQFNKIDDETVLITVDDCAYYKVPVIVFEEGLKPIGDFGYTDLPEGNAAINIRTWNGSLGYDFYWNSITTGVEAPVLPKTLTKEELQAAVSVDAASEMTIDYDNMMITVPFATTSKSLQDALTLGENYTAAVMNGADAVTGETILTAEMTVLLTNSEFDITNGVFSLNVLPEEQEEDDNQGTGGNNDDTDNTDGNNNDGNNDNTGDNQDDGKEDNTKTGVADYAAGIAVLLLASGAFVVFGRKKYSVK